ncbi:oligosaccharide flippase family protein [Zhongshania arctica]|uniref:Oligosaccharide flippase family protein n=1 Tax=Zhongshania arctica TaxID=3238302 RepID=A0ABV3TYY2_9GAMM
MTEHIGFLRNLSWIAAGEMMVRVSRLITTLVLARYLSLNDYGLAALAIATAEIVRVLASNGIGNLIVKAENHKLAVVSATVFWLNLALGLVMFALQYSLSPHIAALYNAPVLSDLLRALSVTHLIYPFAMVQFNLLQRSNRMKEAGLIMGLTVTADNLIAAGLAIAGFGVWSVIWPKIGAALVWVIVINRQVTWQPRWQLALSELKSMRRYSGGVLMAECLRNGRNQIDLFILGRVLSPDLFGLYAFARNAGLGISLSLTQGFNTALLPKLCEAQRSGENLVKSYISALKTGMTFIAPIILLQAVLAPIYVPLLFGEQWADASLLISCLCLSAIPRMIFESGSMFFRAGNDLRKENILAITFTSVFCVAIVFAAQWGALTVTMTMIALYLLAAIVLIEGLVSKDYNSHRALA